MTTRCAECGGAGGSELCRLLFDRLLALEFSRTDPWGPLHGLTVAVYALQHQERFADGGGPVRFAGLHRYVTEGLQAAERRWAQAARGRGAPAEAPRVTSTSGEFTVTIGDVAGPGQDFPAVGHAERVDQWARATHADLIGTSQ